MKVKEFKDKIDQMSAADLKEQLLQLRRELFSLRLNTATAHVKDYSQFKKVRKNIARVMDKLKSEIKEKK